MIKVIITSVLFIVVFSINSKLVEAENLDASFMPTIAKPGRVHAMEKQPDGKILVAGEFWTFNQAQRKNIVRLNADGSVDPSFNPGSGANGQVACIAVQPDGKILLGGEFTTFNGVNSVRLIRLNPNGSIDKTYTIGWIVYSIAVRPDGKFLVSGGFSQSLLRFNADGTQDATFPSTPGAFGSSSYLVVNQPDQKFYLASGFSLPQDRALLRYNEDGTLDSSFNIGNGPVGGQVFSVLIQPDNKIVVIGAFTSFNSVPTHGIVRLNQDGSFDGTFSSNGMNISGENYRGALLSDGKIVVGGFFTHINGNPSGRIMRLNSNGTLDAAYTVGNGFDDPVRAILNDGNDNILVGGDFDNYNGNRHFGMAKLTLAASVDNSFIANAGFPGYVNTIKALPSGKTLIGGDFEMVNGSPRSMLALINSDGTLDSSFNTGTIFNQWIESIDVRPDGKVIVGGQFFQVNGANKTLCLLTADGVEDTGFNPPIFSDRVLRVKALPDGKFMAAGHVTPISSGSQNNILRLNPDGSPDASFNGLTGTDGDIADFEIQPDGKIVIGGLFSVFNGVTKNGIARLNTDGSLDPSFVTTAAPSRGVYDLALQPDGKILIGGNFETVNGVSRKAIARLNPDSTTDTGFNSPFTPNVNSNITDILPRSNGKIVVAGGALRLVFGQITKYVVHLNENGTENASINPNIGESIVALENHPDGRVLVGGFMKFIRDPNVEGPYRFCLGRLTPRAVVSDHDFDGRSDLSVFRPSAGDWYTQNSSNGAFNARHFGQSGDQPAPGDFDGDGKIDISVFRPASGDWFRLNSSDNSFTGLHFGSAGDKPAVGDFDGDGRADIVLFRPSDGTWYLLNSTTGFSAQNFGIAEDKPAVGDFDGDGKSDISLFRPSTGDWYRMNSGNGQFTAVHFGVSGDRPTPADYDGDGRTDISVYRPSVGDWYRLNSGNNSFTGTHFGASGDKPVPGDFDGDGKSDLAVFRPSDGNWYLLNSTSGFTGQHFGNSEDLPTPGAFVY